MARYCPHDRNPQPRSRGRKEETLGTRLWDPKKECQWLLTFRYVQPEFCFGSLWEAQVWLLKHPSGLTLPCASLQISAGHRTFVRQIWGFDRRSVWSDRLTGLFCYDVKYRKIFTLKKDKRALDIMAVTHFDFFFIYSSCITCKHATPANIHTQVAWSSLNNCEDTCKVTLLHWNILFSLLLFEQRNWLPASFPVRDP